LSNMAIFKLSKVQAENIILFPKQSAYSDCALRILVSFPAAG